MKSSEGRKPIPARIYWIATAVSVAVAIGFYAAVYFYTSRTNEGDLSGLARLDEMKATGVPGFELPDLDGRTRALEEQRGKIVILGFWATWCAPCVHEFPSMVKLVSRYGGKVRLVTIAADQRKEDILQFLDAFKFSEKNVVYLWDPSLRVAKEYGTQKLPETYILSRDLKLIKKVASSQDWMDPAVTAYFDQILANP